MNIVAKATPQPNGAIVVETAEGKKFTCSAVRGGISWPLLSANMPAYYCILGEEWIGGTRFQDQEVPRGRLRLLCEYEADIHSSLTSLFVKLTDDTDLCQCSTLYGIIEEYKGDDYKGFPDALNSFIHDKSIGVRLEEAPMAKNPAIGIEHVIDWNTKGLLELPEESLLRQQLRSLKPEDAKDLPERLNAVNALRFVVCGFEKYKPTLTVKDWRSKIKRGTWRSG